MPWALFTWPDRCDFKNAATTNHKTYDVFSAPHVVIVVPPLARRGLALMFWIRRSATGPHHSAASVNRILLMSIG
jgi:hypothetical protein